MVQCYYSIEPCSTDRAFILPYTTQKRQENVCFREIYDSVTAIVVISLEKEYSIKEKIYKRLGSTFDLLQKRFSIARLLLST